MRTGLRLWRCSSRQQRSHWRAEKRDARINDAARVVSESVAPDVASPTVSGTEPDA